MERNGVVVVVVVGKQFLIVLTREKPGLFCLSVCLSVFCLPSIRGVVGGHVEGLKVGTGILVGPPIPETAWAVLEIGSNTTAMSVIFISTTTMCRNGVWGGIKNGQGRI